MTTKDELIQARVDKDLKRSIETTAEDKGLSLAEYLRSLLREATKERVERGTLKYDFLQDIYGVVEDPGDEDGVLDVLKAEWQSLRNDPDRAKIRTKLEGEKPVVVIGQGSSLSVASWFAARLEESEIVAEAKTPEQVSSKITDSVLVFISRSGKTESLVDLARSVDGNEGLVMIGFTQRALDGSVKPDETPLWQETELHVELPLTFDERLVYPTKSVILQMVVLQATILEPDLGKDAFVQRLEHLHSFVRDNLAVEAAENDDETVVGLADDSQFEMLAQRLNRIDEQDLNLVVSGLGWFAPLGNEMVQKYSEFLHFNSTYEDLRSIRHRLINVLYREDTYLLVLVPYRNRTVLDGRLRVPSTYELSELGRTKEPVEIPEDDGEAAYSNSDERRGEENPYKMSEEELFEKNSIEDLLKIRGEPAKFRLAALTFNESDGVAKIESRCRDRSHYHDDGIIGLPGFEDSRLIEDKFAELGDDASDGKLARLRVAVSAAVDESADDLVMMMAFQLYTYAILDVLWDYDDDVKDIVYRSPPGEEADF